MKKEKEAAIEERREKQPGRDSGKKSGE